MEENAKLVVIKVDSEAEAEQLAADFSVDFPTTVLSSHEELVELAGLEPLEVEVNTDHYELWRDRIERVFVDAGTSWDGRRIRLLGHVALVLADIAETLRKGVPPFA